MSKVNSQLSGLLGRVFETSEDSTIIEERYLSKTFLQDNRRISKHGESISFIIDIASGQRSKGNGSSITDRVEPSKNQILQEAAFTSRKIDRRKQERLYTEEEVDSQSDNLKNSYVAASNGRSTTNTISSWIDSVREVGNITSSLREEVLKRYNIKLRDYNYRLKEELATLKYALSKVDQHKYEKLQESYRQLENSLVVVNNEAKDLQRKLHYSTYELNMTKDINVRLERRIEGLIWENSQLCGSLEATMRRVGELEMVEEKLRMIYDQFSLLERQVDKDDNEWEQQKELWLYEKEYYKQIIRKLEFQVGQAG